MEVQCEFSYGTFIALVAFVHSLIWHSSAGSSAFQVRCGCPLTATQSRLTQKSRYDSGDGFPNQRPPPPHPMDNYHRYTYQPNAAYNGGYPGDYGAGRANSRYNQDSFFNWDHMAAPPMPGARMPHHPAFTPARPGDHMDLGHYPSGGTDRDRMMYFGRHGRGPEYGRPRSRGDAPVDRRAERSTSDRSDRRRHTDQRSHSRGPTGYEQVRAHHGNHTDTPNTGLRTYACAGCSLMRVASRVITI
jgi:hypothetical protein